MSHDQLSPLEHRLADLLASRAQAGAGEVDALGAFVARLPARGGRRSAGPLAVAAAVVALIGLAVVATLPRGTSGAAPRPPDPAAFAGDPRLAACETTPDRTLAVFELAHVRDYARQLPRAYPLDGLAADPESPALVVVFAAPGSPDRAGSPAPSGSHDVCLVTPGARGTWETTRIVGVDTSGLLPDLPEATGTPLASAVVAWVDRCGGETAGILGVYPFGKGSGVARRLTLDPAPPELVSAVAGAVVVYDAAHPFAPLGTPPAPGETVEPRAPLAPGHHDLCVLLGADPATAARMLHEDVFVDLASPPTPGSTTAPIPTSASGGVLPDPVGCAAVPLGRERCLAVVEAARDALGLEPAEVTSVSLAAPGSDAPLGGQPVATVAFTLRDGNAASFEVRCGGISIYSLVCSDHPSLMLVSAGGGYTDVPCGPTPGGEPGSACATPLPSVDPVAARAAVPLDVPARDIAILSTGHLEIDVGRAVLPNGVLSDATFSVADPRTDAFRVSGPIRLDVRSLDPSRPPFENLYAHGWYPGTEEVEVFLVLDVTSFTPGATLRVRDLVVR